MSMKRKGNIPSRRMNDTVEVFNTEKVFDGFVWKSELISLGEFAADMEDMKGSRFAYYQNLGFSHPMIIRMRDPEIEFETLKYNGKDLKVKSKITDPDNYNFIIITADYTDGKI